MTVFQKTMEQLNGRKLLSMFYRQSLNWRSAWSKHGWITWRRSNKKRFQYCLDPNGNILYMRAIQDHSQRNRVDLSLQDNVEIPYNWIENINHAGSSHYCHSVLPSDLIAGGKDSKERRQTVLFTAVDPMNEPQRDEPYDVKESREAPYRTKCNVYQNAVYWINLKHDQDRGLILWPTNSNAIILDDSVPADCVEKVVHHKTREILFQKILWTPQN